MKTFAIGLLGAAAVTTTILLVRQQRDEDLKLLRLSTTGDTQSGSLSLERIRELGL